MPMTNAQARVIDPILSTVAQGYQNAEFIFTELFPVVPVGQRGGKIIAFGKEAFRLYNTGRAPGANTKRIQYGYAGVPYALEQHALEGVVPFEHMEDANQVPGIDLGTGAVRVTQDTIQLRNETAAATIARAPGNYAASNKIALSGTSQWSDYTSGISDPTKDVKTGIEAVRKSTGKRANKVILSPAAFAAVSEHPKVIDRFKFTGRDSVTTEMLAQMWKVQKVVVGDAIYEDTAGTLQDVWGKDVIIAFTNTASAQQRGLPSYGYTYRLKGAPYVESPYQDRSAKSWIYPVTDELSPVIAAALAGYLIMNAA